MDRIRLGSSAHWRAGLAVATLLLVAPAVARAQCSIVGPTAAAAQQGFTLCAPYGYQYEWHGPMVPASSTSRCISIDGLERGAYEFVLVIREAGIEIGRCRQIVNVGGSTGGVQSCSIVGPDVIASGATADLCASGSIGLHSYEWSGPGNLRSTESCVSATRAGTYTLTSRNTLTGSRRTCTHVLKVTNTGETGVGDCGSLGPSLLPAGGSVRLCAPSSADVDYRWTRPNGTASATRCLTVTAPGAHTVTMTNRSTGAISRCVQTVSYAEDTEDGNPDAIVSDNCPRTLQYWVSQMKGTGAAANDPIGTTQLRGIAAGVDARSNYFNWTNDVNGLNQALNPPRPMTQRKRLARQYAALLANVVAGERNAVDAQNAIGLDLDTPVSAGSATTIGGLMSEVETMLATGRGNFNRAANTLQSINAGRGIGVVCE